MMLKYHDQIGRNRNRYIENNFMAD